MGESRSKYGGKMEGRRRHGGGEDRGRIERE